MNPKPLMSLKARHEAFCQEYVRTGCDLHKACEAARYTPSYGRWLLADRLISDRIAQLQLAAAEATVNVTAQKVVRHAAALAFSDITEILTITADGELILRGDLDQLPQHVRVAIKSVDVTETTVERDGQTRTTRKVKVQLHDKIEPLKLLAIYSQAILPGGASGDDAAEPWTGFKIVAPPGAEHSDQVTR